MDLCSSWVCFDITILCRTSKTANKLKVLPTSSTKSPSNAQQQAQGPSKPVAEEDDEDDDDDEDEDEVTGGDGVHVS